jgi:hypothetical protein
VCSVSSVAQNVSIKNNKLCETNPISERPKTNLTHYKIKDYDNKSGLLTMGKQTQSNPIYGELAESTCSELACPELACGELVEPVEGVEPILSASGGKLTGKQFEFFDAEGIAQFLQGSKLELADAFLGQAQVLADLLEGLFVLSDK